MQECQWYTLFKWCFDFHVCPYVENLTKPYLALPCTAVPRLTPLDSKALEGVARYPIHYPHHAKPNRASPNITTPCLAGPNLAAQHHTEPNLTAPNPA